MSRTAYRGAPQLTRSIRSTRRRYRTRSGRPALARGAAPERTRRLLRQDSAGGASRNGARRRYWTGPQFAAISFPRLRDL